MHSWDVIPQTNYENNWYNNNYQMKTEPHDGFNGQQPNSPQSMDSIHPETHHSSPVQQQHMMFDSSNIINTMTQLHNVQMQRQTHFNPLTPPGYPGAMIHPQNSQANSTPFRSFTKGLDSIPFGNNVSNLTPSHTPPMDITPPKSPKFNGKETPEKDSLKQDQSQLLKTPIQTNGNGNQQSTFDSGEDSHSIPDSDLLEPVITDGADVDDENDAEEDDDIRTPKINSHGKMKTYKCKQCDFIAVTKLSFWEHNRIHIKPEKMLKCQKCPFITEYKHHLEYHLRNHNGSKPFQCKQCNYSCVNKSMLNSHMKSHSNIYQYRCKDCNYATKYCHSLKLHLRKYSHNPAMVLNSDGTPNPLPIIDVYGTRRGPKVKSHKDEGGHNLLNSNINTSRRSKSGKRDSFPNFEQSQHVSNNPSSQALAMLPNLANIFQQSPSMPLFPYLNLNFHHILAQQKAALSQISPSINGWQNEENCNEEETPEKEEDPKRMSALDLSSNPSTPSTMSQVKHKRKGRAFKLELMKESSDDEEGQTIRTLGEIRSELETPKPVQLQLPTSSTTTPLKTTSEDDSTSVEPLQNLYECKFCDISFKHAVLYTIHMGYHGYNDVFKCNACGKKCEDRVAFFLHIARDAHA
uniref:Protein hunchback n=1 Tax=Clogmia albipunctata TaxID=85120 RepID=B4YK57_CLOAL|nr:putative hunchback [Clogmia albipunctata]